MNLEKIEVCLDSSVVYLYPNPNVDMWACCWEYDSTLKNPWELAHNIRQAKESVRNYYKLIKNYETKIGNLRVSICMQSFSDANVTDVSLYLVSETGAVVATEGLTIDGCFISDYEKIEELVVSLRNKLISTYSNAIIEKIVKQIMQVIENTRSCMSHIFR